jgi:putative membrane protein
MRLVLAFIGIAAILIKILSMGWYVLRFHGYRLELDGNDLRVRCGLLTKVTATVPRDRIQLISVHRPLLERWLGIAHVRIETAGGGEEQEDASTTVGRRWFLPVVAEQDVSTLVSQLNPRIPSEPIPLEWQPLSHRAGSRLMRWGAIVSLAIAGAGAFLRPQWGWSLGFLALAISWWFVRRKMKSRKFASADWGVVFKSGILNLKWSTTCFDKIQSIQLLQSPFDRRWRMASLAIDTVGAGPADHTIQIDLLDEGLAREQYERISAVL